MEKKLKKRSITSNTCYVVALLFFVFSSSMLFAQVNNISGIVTSSDGVPLPGVNVLQKGTKNGVVTDFDGNYTLQLKVGSRTLVFSYLGFETQEVSAANKNSINVSMMEDNQQLDEVVVIGYGTAKKRDVLGSIGSVKQEQILETTPVDALDATQGRIAGVNITSNNGPGAGNEIRIRGTSTFYGGTEPLYIVDGQQLDNIDNIEPSDIASIEILKDGASAAIYGSKSANGVVIITTKKGKPGVAKLEVNYTTKITNISRRIPTSNTRQKNDWVKYRNGADGTAEPDSLSIRGQQVVNVQDLLLRQSISTQANVAFSGGTDNSSFYWNTGLLDESGIIIGSSYKRFTSNLKVDFTISEKLKAGARVLLSYDKSEGQQVNSVLREMSFRTPDVLIYDYDGSYVPSRYAISNPLAIALESTNMNRKFKGNLFNYVEYAFTDNFTFKSTIGASYEHQKVNIFNPFVTLDPTNGKINGEQREGLSYDIQQENYFNYNKEFKGGHSFSALLGMSTQYWKDENGRYRANLFNNDYVETFYNVAEFDLSKTGTDAEGHSLASFFTRASYDYEGKYLIAATFRRDGSSRFGENNRWGDFPSASAGWRVSKEKFFKPLSKVVSDFKLRASYAITGNERIGNYKYESLYTPGQFYNGVNGIAASNMANNNLGWETTAQYNFGLDISLFKNRINLTVDRYVKTTTDLLYNVPVPEETGFSSVLTNIGSVENRGLEFAIDARIIRTKDFSWNSNFNIAFNDNKVLKLNDPDGFFAGDYKISEGESIGNMYGFNNLGIYRYDESNAYATVGDQRVQLTPNFDAAGVFVNYSLNGQDYSGAISQNKFGSTVLKGGDIIWEDLNNDGNIDATNDRKIVGNGIAKFSGGFYNKLNYKQFSLSCLVNYNFGNDIYRYYDYYRDRSDNSIHVPGPDRIDGAWKEQGDIAEYASLDKRKHNYPEINSQYVSKADFIKIKNVQLTYNFSKEVIEKINIFDQLSMSFSVNNVMTFTNYNGYNPEISSRGNALEPGKDQLRYPSDRSFIFSLKTRF